MRQTILLWSLFVLFGQHLGAAAVMTEANRMVEVSFESARLYADPFNEATLDVVFTTPEGKSLRVPAFWGGGKIWRVRYASPQIGLHRFRAECSDTGNTALHGVSGEVVRSDER